MFNVTVTNKKKYTSECFKVTYANIKEIRIWEDPDDFEDTKFKFTIVQAGDEEDTTATYSLSLWNYRIH